MKTNTHAGSDKPDALHVLTWGFLMNPDSADTSLRELRESATRPIEDAPEHQIIGTDGSGWYKQVGHEHDVRSNKSSLAELRQQLRERITSQIAVHKNRPQAGLLKMLELTLVRSDSAVFRSADLVGVKPSDGLYTKVKAILVVEDELDPNSELWALLGIAPK